MDYAKESLKMHYELKGKIEVVLIHRVLLSLVWRSRRM